MAGLVWSPLLNGCVLKCVSLIQLQPNMSPSSVSVQFLDPQLWFQAGGTDYVIDIDVHGLTELRRNLQTLPGERWKPFNYFRRQAYSLSLTEKSEMSRDTGTFRTKWLPTVKLALKNSA